MWYRFIPSGKTLGYLGILPQVGISIISLHNFRESLRTLSQGPVGQARGFPVWSEITTQMMVVIIFDS